MFFYYIHFIYAQVALNELFSCCSVYCVQLVYFQFFIIVYALLLFIVNRCAQ